jgi:hypothetical protein
VRKPSPKQQGGKGKKERKQAGNGGFDQKGERKKPPSPLLGIPSAKKGASKIGSLKGEAQALQIGRRQKMNLMNALEKIGFHTRAVPEGKIGRAQNLKPSSFLIRASVLEIIRQPEDPHDSNQMENEQEAPNPCSGVSVFEDFVREKLKLDGTSGNKAHREDEEKYGEKKQADILASARQQRARTLKSRFHQDTVWDSFQNEKEAAKKPRAAIMSAVTKAPCANMLGKKRITTEIGIRHTFRIVPWTKKRSTLPRLLPIKKS